MAESARAVRMTSNGRLLTAEEAGELLQVTARWLLKEARAGRVPHIRLGRSVRFRSDSLLEWVEEQERGPVRANNRRAKVNG